MYKLKNDDLYELNELNVDAFPLECMNFKVSTKEEINYNIISSEDIFNIDNPTLYLQCKNKSIAVFISPTINKYYGKKIAKYFAHYFLSNTYHIKEIPTTENNKTLKTVEMINTFAKENNIDRTGIMIAIGGGVINDIVGFAASMYKRGIKYIRICTTLLGQVDVALGIKVGVNFQESKNFIGAFYPPYRAINDKRFLLTLKKSDISCGLSEIIKMAIIWDDDLFNLLELEHTNILMKKFDTSNFNLISQLAISSMLDNLRPNLFERDLERLVDFGHTFSTIIESSSNYKISHGYAVAMDMAISSTISYLMGYLNSQSLNRILKLLNHCGLPIFDESCCTLEHMKKSLFDAYLHRGKELNLVIPISIGEAIFVKELEMINDILLGQALSYLKSLHRNSDAIRRVEEI